MSFKKKNANLSTEDSELEPPLSTPEELNNGQF